MSNYRVTITRRLIIRAAPDAKSAVVTALTHEMKPTDTQVRIGDSAVRVEVERWEDDHDH